MTELSRQSLLETGPVLTADFSRTSFGLNLGYKAPCPHRLVVLAEEATRLVRGRLSGSWNSEICVRPITCADLKHLNHKTESRRSVSIPCDLHGVECRRGTIPFRSVDSVVDRWTAIGTNAEKLCHLCKHCQGSREPVQSNLKVNVQAGPEDSSEAT